MNTCKYCNTDISYEDNFCSNCGFINFKDTDSIFTRLLTQFKYMFINPVAFIRSTKLVNPIFTSSMALIIILIEALVIKGFSRELRSDISPLNAIFATFIIVAIESFFIFCISKGILKKNVSYFSFINLILGIQLISSILNLIGAFLGYILAPIFFFIISIFISFFTLLLMYQGLKDFLNTNIRIALLTFLSSISGTTLVVFVVLKILLKNALRSIF